MPGTQDWYTRQESPARTFVKDIQNNIQQSHSTIILLPSCAGENDGGICSTGNWGPVFLASMLSVWIWLRTVMSSEKNRYILTC